MKEPLLVQIAKERLQHTNNDPVQFVEDTNVNIFLNDLDLYPHAYVLACLMDRQIKAERAWMIPWHIKEYFQTFEIDELAKISLNDYTTLFKTNKLHRFNENMAEVFYLGVHDIVNKYNGNASNIWSDNPSSSLVVYRFLEFKGCGVKIATMAANILARQMKIPFTDYYSIDISPDVHVMRVMKRMGFIPYDANTNMVIYKARELYPSFPGIIDSSCWEIGRTWCKPGKPDCDNCIVEPDCEKVIE